MITIKEVSELAQVSQSTVSRTLNGHASVKERNRQKVFAAIEQLGYTPNAFAQALASSRSNSIGMLVGSLAGPFYGPLMHYAEETAREHNMHLIVASGQESKSRELDSIRFLQSKRVDGMILHTDKLSDDELVHVVKCNPNTVVLNRYIADIAQHCLYLDNELGGYLATQLLLENGHRRIACITGQQSKVDTHERLQGYQRALLEYGIPFDSNLVVEGRFDHQGNHEAAQTLLQRKTGASAIFCQNDAIALAVYDLCYEHNIKVGEELAIVGFDNDTYSQHIRPRLTTVNFPIKKMGEVAVKMLLAMTNKTEFSQEIKLLPSLVIRESTPR
ncbi:LacI family DNA-binding transcriptional regulator [Vibrio sp. FNV 38]|nr:LacI family DNA-binding transcriptional regulator [Vibrio sp. FNV 38]